MRAGVCFRWGDRALTRHLLLSSVTRSAKHTVRPAPGAWYTLSDTASLDASASLQDEQQPLTRQTSSVRKPDAQGRRGCDAASVQHPEQAGLSEAESRLVFAERWGWGVTAKGFLFGATQLS